MDTPENILDILREKGAEAARKAQRGIIVQPGAIGDCILTLPLAAFMKDALGLGGVYILGHSEYIGILPGRTCIDGISSIDSIELHRLFMETKAFDLKDGDPLINTFSGYACIATFLGESNSNFEQNLIFTATCSHSAEVITLSMKPPKDYSGHLTDFYIHQFIKQSDFPLQPRQVNPGDCIIKVSETDMDQGKELLKEAGLEPDRKIIVIQPGSGGVNKCWHINNFLAIAKTLDSEGISVIFLLGPAELDRFNSTTIKNISSVAKYLTDLSMPQVLGLLSCANAFIGNDSGITHLAAALGIKTLAVFGPTNPTLYRPIGPDVRVFTDNMPTFATKPSPSLQRELLDLLTTYESL
ncbi:MAG: glycosyltransferase family 9 protein [Phycisphaerales bacterium]|jgi:hypothetical protein